MALKLRKILARYRKRMQIHLQDPYASVLNRREKVRQV